MKIVWPDRVRGIWDHGLLMNLAEGRLWPTVSRCAEDLEPTPASLAGDAAIVVVAWPWYQTHGPERLRSLLDGMRGYVLVHTSDEEQRFPSNLLRKANGRTWVQTPKPGLIDGDRRFLFGSQYDTQDLLRDVARRPVAERPLTWAFGGQVNHVQRQRLVTMLRGRDDGDLFVSEGFSLGRPRKDHLAVLANTAVAPCPSGPHTPDSFRLYEAIEAGCLPVSDRRAPRWPAESYWTHVLGHEPFPCVDEWGEFPGILDHVKSDPAWAQSMANKAGAWWIGYKRKFACDMIDDVIAVGSAAPAQHAVTVLMPTSSIPSHPSTDVIEDAIRRTRSYPDLRDAEVIIMVDGLHPNHQHRAAEYEEYKRRLIELCAWHPEFRGCLPLIFDEHMHQAGMARAALKLVRTPLILYQEHDTHPVNEIDWAGLIRTFEEPSVNVITLHIYESVLDEHRYLMMGDVQDVRGVPLLRHRKWSQRPHLARTDWYRWMLGEFFGRGSKTMIEDCLYSIVYNQVQADPGAWERFGLWLYHPEDATHGILRSSTSDGRQGEPKIPLLMMYDGETPPGAPSPGLKHW